MTCLQLEVAFKRIENLERERDSLKQKAEDLEAFYQEEQKTLQGRKVEYIVPL